MEEGEIEMEEGEIEMEEKGSEYTSDKEHQLKDLLPSTQFGTKSFKDLGVSPWLIENLSTVGIKTPTLIQEQSLCHSLKNNGEHIIGCAHTGSGKTACFAIPILQKLAKDPFGIFGLVMTPTRELAF